MLDGFRMPAALLARSGEVLAVNAAWRASSPSADQPVPRVGENYFEWSAALLGWEPWWADGAPQAEEQTSSEQICRRRGDDHALRIRIRQIQHDAFDGFLVSHEAIAALSSEEVEDRVLAAQLEERERLAAELHDAVGQNLVCLGLGLTRLRRAAPPQSELANIVGDMAELLQQVHAEIRTLSFLLQPPWPDDANIFEASIRDLVAGFARRAGFSAKVEVEGQPQDLCGARQLTLFRILQEALVNVYRHAKADQVRVELLCRRNTTILKVSDNGHGIPMHEGAAPTAGVGLVSMRRRLRKFGGDLRIVSGQDGTTITAKLPATFA